MWISEKFGSCAWRWKIQRGRPVWRGRGRHGARTWRPCGSGAGEPLNFGPFALKMDFRCSMIPFRILRMLAAAAPAVVAAAAQTQPVSIQSPNRLLEISIATRAGNAVAAGGGQLAYRVTFRGKPVLDWSDLGLILDGAPPLGTAVRIQRSNESSEDETWTPVAGKAGSIRNHYTAVRVETVETGENGRRLELEARAYDDGVAFRYVVPQQPRLTD